MKKIYNIIICLALGCQLSAVQSCSEKASVASMLEQCDAVSVIMKVTSFVHSKGVE